MILCCDDQAVPDAFTGRRGKKSGGIGGRGRRGTGNKVLQPLVVVVVVVVVFYTVVGGVDIVVVVAAFYSNKLDGIKPIPRTSTAHDGPMTCHALP